MMIEQGTQSKMIEQGTQSKFKLTLPKRAEGEVE